jgi:hypothetical protein
MTLKEQSAAARAMAEADMDWKARWKLRDVYCEMKHKKIPG